MDRKKIYSSRYHIFSGKILNELIIRNRAILMFLALTGGVLCGALIIRNGGGMILDKLTILIDSYKSVRIQQGIAANFCNSLLSGQLFWLCNIFLGFSAAGAPLLIALPFARGAGLGMICGYLYSAYRLTGLGYCLIIIYPGAAVTLTAFLFACGESYKLSKNIFGTCVLNSKSIQKGEIKQYLKKQSIYAAVIAVAALIDALVTAIFSSFFTF